MRRRVIPLCQMPKKKLLILIYNKKNKKKNRFKYFFCGNNIIGEEYG